MPTEIKITKNGIDRHLTAMIDRAKGVEAYLNRVVYPEYQNAQRERWMTEGASQGKPWAALNPIYAARKRIIYGGGPKFEWVGGRPPWRQAGSWPTYPGAGTKMMIATNRLQRAVIGPSPDHRKLVTQKSLTVTVNVPYAKYADEARPFWNWSKPWLKNVLREYREYVRTGR